MTRNDRLLERLQEIGYGGGDVESRVRAATTAIRDERTRFSDSDAGRMQWNWYLRQLSADIRLERVRLADLARRPARPGKRMPAELLTLFEGLRPHILDLSEGQ